MSSQGATKFHKPNMQVSVIKKNKEDREDEDGLNKVK